MLLLTIGCLVAVFVSWNLTYFLRSWLQRRGVMDVPNARSSHERPIPRGGGIGLLAGTFAGLIVLQNLSQFLPLPTLWFFVGWWLIIAISYLDDRGTLHPGLRFAVQAIAAALIVWDQGGFTHFPAPAPFDLPLGVLGYPLAWFWIMAVLNIYNFMDGINGFAGVQAVLGGCFLAWLDPAGPGAILGPLLALATVGFLYFNAGKASIFMGDIGSVSLGFFFAAIPFYGQSLPAHELSYGIIVALWFFLADGAFTLLRRLLRGKKPWQAHREHYYQQLVIAGWSHSAVVTLVMGTAALYFLAAYALQYYLPAYSWGILVLGFALMICYWLLVRTAKKKSQTTPTPSASGPST